MANEKKVGVLLSGCGVYDGSEIHESVLTLLCLEQNGLQAVCLAPDIEQHHVIDHTNGEELSEKRNVLVEASRIARGNIKPVKNFPIESIDALAMPGGFGVAKNFTKWAFEGVEGSIEPQIKDLIVKVVKAGKPIVALCMSPTTVARALQGTGIKADLTVGTNASKSLYDIAAIGSEMKKAGANPVMCEVDEIVVDPKNKIISSPCYMMDVSITEIYKGIEKTIAKLAEMLKDS
ncbi:MAG: isoprenoid biosynthesis glyoxalase ElbB [Leptospiraceae bacterium]|nr:isoprenoid biosynthesis glyoxalase ElbB [Leptospiraceae bacterium]MCP5496189.1 isoprenoid biosynthesis glyoxalase ElbB [Leptospiraceae bacterium]